MTALSRAPGREPARVQWDAEIVDDTPGERIAWRCAPGADVGNEGEVRFTDAPNGRGTELRVILKYDLPGGRPGRGALPLRHPAHRVDGRGHVRHRCGGDRGRLGCGPCRPAGHGQHQGSGGQPGHCHRQTVRRTCNSTTGRKGRPDSLNFCRRSLWGKGFPFPLNRFVCSRSVAERVGARAGWPGQRSRQACRCGPGPAAAAASLWRCGNTAPG